MNGESLVMRLLKLCGYRIIGLALVLGVFHTAARSNTTNEAKNITLVLDYWAKVWSKGVLEAVAEFYDPACKHRDNFTIATFEKNVTRIRAAFPDFTVKVEEIFAKEDRVVCRVTYYGTHSGSKFMGQEPMNAKIAVPGLDVFVIRNGKCVEHMHVADHLDMVLQMGIQLTPKPTSDSKNERDKGK